MKLLKTFIQAYKFARELGGNYRYVSVSFTNGQGERASQIFWIENGEEK